jgi:hypothetical protein
LPTRQADPSTHAAGGRLGLPVLLAALFLVAGCAGDSTTTPPAGDGPAPDNPAPDFSVVDVNETSPRFDEMVSPRDYLGEVSAWYFGHAT